MLRPRAVAARDLRGGSIRDEHQGEHSRAGPARAAGGRARHHHSRRGGGPRAGHSDAVRACRAGRAGPRRARLRPRPRAERGGRGRGSGAAGAPGLLRFGHSFAAVHAMHAARPSPARPSRRPVPARPEPQGIRRHRRPSRPPRPVAVIPPAPPSTTGNTRCRFGGSSDALARPPSLCADPVLRPAGDTHGSRNDVPGPVRPGPRRAAPRIRPSGEASTHARGMPQQTVHGTARASHVCVREVAWPRPAAALAHRSARWANASVSSGGATTSMSAS